MTEKNVFLCLLCGVSCWLCHTCWCCIVLDTCCGCVGRIWCYLLLVRPVVVGDVTHCFVGVGGGGAMFSVTVFVWWRWALDLVVVVWGSGIPVAGGFTIFVVFAGG